MNGYDLVVRDPVAQPPDGRTKIDTVQCPNCCRQARVTSRRMGLLFFECDLCGSVGATPDPNEAA